jgi:shikimate dehydrogenase
LVLGTGGASQAVQAALKALNIEFMLVSRNSNNSYQTVYEQVSKKIMRNHLLIINTTPLGMYPKIDECPPLPYHFLTPEHLLYDLIYNPEITLFLKKGLEAEAKIKGGLEMLHLQAEKSWEIWNEM